jgi:soluble lytic murein transglycosylase-like protein
MAFTTSGNEFEQAGLNHQKYLTRMDSLNRRAAETDEANRTRNAGVTPPTQYKMRGMPTGENPATQQVTQKRPSIAEQNALAAEQDATRPLPEASPQTGLASQVGRTGAEGITQISGDVSAPVQAGQKLWAQGDINERIFALRKDVTFGNLDAPATNAIARVWSWATDAVNSPIHAERAKATEAGEWLDSRAFLDLISSNPKKYLAEAEADPYAFYKKYANTRPTAPAAAEDRQVTDWKPNDPVTIAPGAGFKDGNEMLYDMVQFHESANDPNAVSEDGAIGLWQIMPKTGKKPGYGVTPLRNNSPEENRRFGIDYLEAMMHRYGGDQVAALAAYNWGPGSADAWVAYGKNPAELPAETRDYISKIVGDVSGVDPFEGQQTAGLATPELTNLPYIPGQTEVEVKNLPHTGEAGVQVPLDNTQSVQIQGNGRTVTGRGGITDGAASVSQQAATKTADRILEPARMSYSVRSSEMNTLGTQREAILRQMRIAAGAGKGGSAEFNKLSTALSTHDNLINNMAVQQGIDTFESSDDPRLLSAIISQQNNVDYQIGRNSDGTWFEQENGQVINNGLTMGAIVSQQRQRASKAYQDAVNASMASGAAEERGKQIDAMLKIAVKDAEQNNEAYIERLKKAGFSKGTDGDYWVNEQGEAYRIAEGEGIDGQPLIQLQPVSTTGDPLAFKRS